MQRERERERENQRKRGMENERDSQTDRKTDTPVSKGNGVFLDFVGQGIHGINDDRAEDKDADEHHGDGHHLLQVTLLSLIQHL